MHFASRKNHVEMFKSFDFHELICRTALKPDRSRTQDRSINAFTSRTRKKRRERQYVASTDCRLQNTKQALRSWQGAETDFCSSLLNGGVHLYTAVKHYKAICAPHPKSFRSISPLQFILYKPPEGAGEREVTGEAQTAEGTEQPG